MIASFLVRLKALVFRRTAEAELDEELRYHLEREIERNIANGMSPSDARDAARRALGNLTVATEQAREAVRWRWLEELRQDLSFTARSARRAPLFVFTVVATIGVGLGLLVTLFTLFNAYVLRPLAVRDPAALYEVSWRSRSGWHAFATDTYRTLRPGDFGMSQIFAYEIVATRALGRPLMGQAVTGNYFDMLGVPPALGRTLSPNDDVSPAAAHVVVLSFDTWRSMFGGDSSVIGRRVMLNGTPLRIVGVAREGFGGLSSWPFQFWAPIAVAPELQGWKRINTIARTPEPARIVGRVAQGVSVEQARERTLAWLRATTSYGPDKQRAMDVALEPRGTSIPLTPELIAVFGPVVIAFGLVMLIACANVANMMLARGMARQREIGIRLALGAGRARLIRQLLTESVALSVIAGALGFAVSRATIDLGMRAMFASTPKEYVPYLRPVPLSPDLRVAGFVLGASIVAALAFGLVPTLRATRPDIVRASRGDFDTQFRPARLRSALVVAQIAMSVLLLISAGVLLGAAYRFERIDSGIRTDNVMQFEVLDRSRERVLAALGAEPQVQRVASASRYPLDGLLLQTRVKTTSDSIHVVSYNVVSHSYFDVLGIPLVRGRAFTDDETRARASVALVSESAARTLWPGREPLGGTLTLAVDDSSPLLRYRQARVIGVVRDVVPGWIGVSRESPIAYFPAPLDAAGSAILVKVNGTADAMLNRIERAAAGVDSGAVEEMHTLNASMAVQVYPFRAAYWVATGIGMLALLLTLTGVHGVLGYVVSQRRREFGIRMALGARPSALVGLVLAYAMRLSLIGFAVGGGLALAVSIALASVIYAVNPFDPLGYASGAGVVFVACAIAAYVPSRRAALVDPVEALRAE